MPDRRSSACLGGHSGSRVLRNIATVTIRTIGHTEKMVRLQVAGDGPDADNCIEQRRRGEPRHDAYHLANEDACSERGSPDRLSDRHMFGRVVHFGQMLLVEILLDREGLRARLSKLHAAKTTRTVWHDEWADVDR